MLIYINTYIQIYRLRTYMIYIYGYMRIYVYSCMHTYSSDSRGVGEKGTHTHEEEVMLLLPALIRILSHRCVYVCICVSGCECERGREKYTHTHTHTHTHKYIRKHTHISIRTNTQPVQPGCLHQLLLLLLLLQGIPR